MVTDGSARARGHGGKALTQVLKVLLRVGVSSAFGVLKVKLSSASPDGYSAE